MAAISRKFNDGSLEARAPSYRSLTWIERPDGRLAFVTFDRDEDNLEAWRGREVIIDGIRHHCLQMLTYRPGPVCRGDTVGMLVAAP
jgi:hypothetical protein